MKFKILLTFVFICLQLFLYADFSEQNYTRSINLIKTSSHSQFDNKQNGTIAKTQSDGHIVSWNMSAKSLVSSQKKTDNQFFTTYVPDFRSCQKNALLKYISDKSRLKNNNKHIAFQTEIQRRAP